MPPAADLFADEPRAQRIALGPQAVVLRQRASPLSAALLQAIGAVLTAAPLHTITTPGGRAMSVRTSSCGARGWVSGPAGYHYASHNPETGAAWPAMPDVVYTLAQEAAEEAGFAHFQPDSCLINRYTMDSKMALHQDRDEADFTQPIVSISLGMDAKFLWGGMQRSDRASHILLTHGDVVVWGGVDRLRFHGVKHLTGAPHPTLGAMRYNLTLRCAR